MRSATISTDRRVLFAAFATLVIAFEATVARTEVYRSHTDTLSLAVLADLLLVLPLVFWWLVVRAGRAAPRAIVTIFAAGALAASYVLPHPPAFLAPLRWLPALGEIALLVWGVVAGRSFFQALRRQGATSDDALENVRLALAETRALPAAIQAMAAEVVVLWYGLCAYRVKADGRPGRFGYHEPFVALMVLGLLATPAEGAALHVLLRGWSHTAAWVMTALHVYSMVWMVALYQAARLRPHVLGDGQLLVRWSLLWTGTIPVEHIQRAVRLKERPERRESGTVDVARLGDRPFRLETAEGFVLHGPFGLTRRGTSLLIAVDQPARFEAALRDAGIAVG